MSVKVGITGGIGSGKSVVSRLFEVLGIPIYISDQEAKRLTATHPEIRNQLIQLLGDEVYANNELNKPFLANYLFASEENAERINRIIHPVVKADFEQWAASHSHYPIIGMESAILIESGSTDVVDKIIMVYAPAEVRINRAIKRDNSSRELITKRIEAQMNDEEKRLHADYVILNDGEIPLIPQVLELISSLSQNIPYLCDAKNNIINLKE